MSENAYRGAAVALLAIIAALLLWIAITARDIYRQGPTYSDVSAIAADVDRIQRDIETLRERGTPPAAHIVPPPKFPSGWGQQPNPHGDWK